MKKKLLLCISDPTIRNFLTDEVSQYLGEIIEPVAINPSEVMTVDFDPEAVVVSHKTKSLIKRYFPNAKLINQTRYLSGNALEKVVALPNESTVIVVNQYWAAAKETIDCFRTLGINHISMYPYAPGQISIPSHVDAVIYTGIKEDCPELDCPYIDIGLRKISLETIMDIIRAFNLPSEYVSDYYNYSIRMFTNACYKLNETVKKANELKKNFEKLSDINNNITFIINKAGEVTLFNNGARKFFDIKELIAILGTHYTTVFKRFPELLEIINSKASHEDKLVKINDQQLLLSTFDMGLPFSSSTAYILLPLAAVKKREGIIRKNLNATGFSAKYSFDDILGNSNYMERTKKLASIYASTDSPVLITGESGTGKELFAQAIHSKSSRRSANFVAISFAALPETLAESELFGYMEGAFTGASKTGKAGMFELAHEGTIFLDEIGDAPLSVQAKLLRVLETKEIVRIGGTSVIPINVRIICATNKDLVKAINEGSFREDLFYRIKVLNLQLKPLRERPEDILQTLNSMLSNKCAYYLAGIPDVKEKLLNYNWPGNAREIRAVAEYINMLSSISDEGEALEMLRLYIDNNLTISNSVSQNIRPAAKSSITEHTAQASPDYPYLGNDLIAVLKAISFLHNRSITAGRNSIANTDYAIELGLTESKIKNRLKKLESMGLVISGKTKQGASLTPKGLQLLANIDK